MHRFIAVAAAALAIVATGCAETEPVENAVKPTQTTTTQTTDTAPVEPAVEVGAEAGQDFLGEVNYEDEPVEEETIEPSMTTGEEQALESAQGYIDMGGFSKKGLIDQLVYEEFSRAEAKFAADNVDVSWKDQAVQSAEGYMKVGGFSRAGLLDQLLYEEFTKAQAQHAVNEVYR